MGQDEVNDVYRGQREDKAWSAASFRRACHEDFANSEPFGNRSNDWRCEDQGGPLATSGGHVRVLADQQPRKCYRSGSTQQHLSFEHMHDTLPSTRFVSAFFTLRLVFMTEIF